MSLVRALRAMPALLRVGAAEMTAYRAEMVVWILSATLPLVMMALWGAAAEAADLPGFGSVEVARYFTVMLVVRQLTGMWLVWEFNQQVRTGTLSPQLLRPMHPLWWAFAETVAAIPWRMIVLAPIVVALFVWRPEIAWVPDLAHGGAFLVSLTLAWGLGWAIQCAFSMLAFWFDEALGAWQAWFFLWGLFGGYLVPQALMPASVRAVAAWLPFRATIGAPVEVLLGLAPIGEVLALQALWLGVFAAVATLAWRAGIRRYGAVGA